MATETHQWPPRRVKRSPKHVKQPLNGGRRGGGLPGLETHPCLEPHVCSLQIFSLFSYITNILFIYSESPIIGRLPPPPTIHQPFTPPTTLTAHLFPPPTPHRPIFSTAAHFSHSTVPHRSIFHPSAQFYIT